MDIGNTFFFINTRRVTLHARGCIKKIWNERFVGLYDSSCGDVTLVDDTLRLMTINHFLLYFVYHIGSKHNRHLHCFLSNGYLQLELMLCHVCHMLYLHSNTRCVMFFFIVSFSFTRQSNQYHNDFYAIALISHTQRENVEAHLRFD